MDAVGYVYDKATGQTLPGVSIAARNIQGQYTNQGTPPMHGDFSTSQT
jgi:hypothetical protein